MVIEPSGPWPTRWSAAPPQLVVSVHDVAPPTATASRTWARVMAPLGVPLTFLVVPGPWRGARFGDAGDDGLDLAAWLRSRQERCDEVALHGWCHRADVPGPAPRRLVGSLVARGAAELWALDRASVARRTCEGIDVLHGHGLAVTGSTPPGWLASAAALAGLADAGLQYATDHTGLTDLTSGRRWRAPAICHRPAAVRARTNWLEQTGRRAVISTARLIAAGWSVRLGLHPGDLDRPGLQSAAVVAVRGCLDAGAVPTTYEVILGRLRDGA